MIYTFELTQPFCLKLYNVNPEKYSLESYFFIGEAETNIQALVFQRSNKHIYQLKLTKDNSNNLIEGFFL
jgi:hypothetical protein